MKITTITYLAVKNLGNYESERLEATADVESGEDPKNVAIELRSLGESSTRCSSQVDGRINGQKAARRQGRYVLKTEMRSPQCHENCDRITQTKLIMNQTPTIIKVPSVYFVKLPHGEWVNLALCRSVEVQDSADSLVPDINFVIVRLTFDTGRTKTYSGAKAAAILDALTETAYIDKSQTA